MAQGGGSTPIGPPKCTIARAARGSLPRRNVRPGGARSAHHTDRCHRQERLRRGLGVAAPAAETSRTSASSTARRETSSLPRVRRASGAGHTIQNQGSGSLPAETTLNFTGAGVVASDGTGKTNVTIPATVVDPAATCTNHALAGFDGADGKLLECTGITYQRRHQRDHLPRRDHRHRGEHGRWGSAGRRRGPAGHRGAAELAGRRTCSGCATGTTSSIS